MTQPQTLLSMAGADYPVAPLSQSTLLIIDAQNEYLTGPLKLTGVEDALAQIARLIARARAAGTPIVHVQHEGAPNGPFDVHSHRGQIADLARPIEHETVIRKTLPNAFAATGLQSELAKHDHKNLLVVGFMTHMCVSSTVRAALDLKIPCTVVASATATRDLPGLGDEPPVMAVDLQRGCLAALADRFATIVPTIAEISD